MCRGSTESSTRQYGVIHRLCIIEKLLAAQATYPSFKGELLAIVVGIKKFEHMLQCRKSVLQTDVSAMKYLETLHDNRGMFCRWQLYLAQFDFDVQHRSGTSHVNADVLSRHDDVISPTPEQVSLIENLGEEKTPLLSPPQLREISNSSF